MLRDSSGYGLGGRFVLEEAVGTGSMGTVFRARDTHDDRIVAIKALKSMDPSDVLRFEREFAIVSQLSHPAIVGCWETGTTASGERYIVMEWLEGESLRERLRRSELTLRETAALARRLLDGLVHAHERGVVHRDVKPANVFLVGGDVRQAKLVDFGIARYVEAGETLTRAGEIVGTPGYVSPEQIQGRRVDQRSDVYSLGCLLYRCLSGSPVFEDDNVLEVLVRATRDRATPLGDLRPDLPAALAGLIDRMLEREPVDRPVDAAAVARELELVLGADESAFDLERLDADAPPAARLRGRASPRAGADDAEERTKPSHSTRLDAAGGAPIRPPRPGLAALAGFVTAVGLVALAVSQLGPRSTADAIAPASATASVVTPFGEADQLVGKDARAAWGSIRIGSRAAALRRMAQRAESGDASASERLWLALLSPPGDDAKRHQRDAATRAHELTAFERAVVEAASPLLASPPDIKRTDAALAALAREAGSTELWSVLSRLRVQRSDKAGAYAAVERMQRPGWEIAQLLDRQYVDKEFYDVKAGRDAAQACVASRPDAVDCIAALARRAALDGDCSAMERYARDWVGTDPDDPAAYEMVAFSLAARDGGDAAIREALEQKWARVPERERASVRLHDLTNHASLEGDFDQALTYAREAVSTLPADTSLRSRLVASFTLLLVLSEIEDKRAVGELAHSVLERAAGATPPTPSEAAYYLLFVAAAEQSDNDPRYAAMKKLSFDRYHAYLASQGDNLRPYQRMLPWIVGYAAGVETPERMRAAYEALPKYGEPPAPGVYTDDVDLVIGKTLAGSGERERGVAYLRRASGSCLILENPYAVVRTHALLGEMLETFGDAVGARAAYDKAIAVWGNARPRAKSARRAREGLKRLDGE